MNPPTIHVLLVDDDPDVAQVLLRIVGHLGEDLVADPVWAGSGAAARAELARRRFQLVLLDYRLPDEDGLSLLLTIREQPAAERPVVIMLTGAGSEHVAVESMKLGAMDYIVKTDLNVAALRRNILGALARRRLEDELARSAEDLRRRSEQTAADLALARGVQQALLPQQYPEFPAGAPAGRGTLRFCHRWMPCEVVAGDFFDVFRVTREVAGVFLCDVMGHGVRAALVAALVRGLVHEHLGLARDPGRFLAEINGGLQALLGQTGDLVFVTAAYLTVDARSGQVALALAGHPAPLHLRRRQGTVGPVPYPGGPGPALGLQPDAGYHVQPVAVESGDALLLFTDGVFEAANSSGEEFGRERLGAAVRQALARPTPELLDQVLIEAGRFRVAEGEEDFADDVCLLAVDFTPQPAVAGVDNPLADTASGSGSPLVLGGPTQIPLTDGG